MSEAEAAPRFWETTALADMSASQWESLCDGCGRCCLVKLEDEDDDSIYFTRVACQLLDHQSCSCKQYEQRLSYVPDCIQLNAHNVHSFHWLPSTCAYRIVAEKGKLPDWHPLLSGDVNSVHDAGVSMSGVVICETHVQEQDLEDHIIHWVK